MGSRKILVVEDEPDILDLISRFLVLRGYRVIRATSGAEGASLMQVEEPDLMLTDKNLPDCEGYDLIELSKLRECTERMKTLLITGDHASMDCDPKSRPDGILLKPFGLTELGVAIDSLL